MGKSGVEGLPNLPDVNVAWRNSLLLVPSTPPHIHRRQITAACSPFANVALIWTKCWLGVSLFFPRLFLFLLRAVAGEKGKLWLEMAAPLLLCRAPNMSSLSLRKWRRSSDAKTIVFIPPKEAAL